MSFLSSETYCPREQEQEGKGIHISERKYTTEYYVTEQISPPRPEDSSTTSIMYFVLQVNLAFTDRLRQALNENKIDRSLLKKAIEMASYIDDLLVTMNVKHRIIEYDVEEWPESEFEDFYIRVIFRLPVENYERLFEIWKECIKNVEKKFGRWVFKWITVIFRRI